MTLPTFIKKTAMFGMAVGAAIAVAQPSSASTLLDFTDSTTTVPGGSAFGTTYTISTTGGGLTTNMGFDGTICPSPLACDRDGLGVRNDEITGIPSVDLNQSITIEFAESVELATLYLLDLFVGIRAEKAAYAINGGAAQTVTADPAGASQGGFRAVSLGGASVKTISFTAPSQLGDNFTNDYAVAALQAVPLPPAILMLLSSLGGLALLGRRRRALA